MIAAKSVPLVFASWAVTVSLATITLSQEKAIRASGQFESTGVWTLRIELSDAERAAMEPPPPQFQGFGGTTAVPAVPTEQPKRSSVPNLFGTRFPIVQGKVHLVAANELGSAPCQLRYDGDFTYMMSAAGPKRPMHLTLAEGRSILGSKSFRLHTMQFDPTMMRERVTAHIFDRMKVPAPRVGHAEVSMASGVSEPKLQGLYTILESVDESFLMRNAIPSDSLVMQTNGLNSIQYIGNEWTAYAPHFRTARVPSKIEQDRIIAFARLIAVASEEEFKSQIEKYVDVSALLRYIAANAITSNLTGFSSIGANDFLCLDSASGQFHFIASEMEIALSGSVLSGTPEQLASLSMMHPYAGECKLIDRLLKVDAHKETYLQIVREAIGDAFSVANMNAVIDAMEKETVEARSVETKLIEERTKQQATGFGGGGFGAGGPALPKPMDIRTFVKKRNDSIVKQLSESDKGYVPTPPVFPGSVGGANGGSGGFGPPNRRGAQSPISDAQFRESVQVPNEFDATLFAKSPEVNYPVAISAGLDGVIYVASDEQGSLGTNKDGGKIVRCVDKDGDGVMDSVTTFCRVDHVRGVVNRGDSVWVCHPPFLSVFHDDDGDGVADRKQQLVSGLTTELVNTRGGDHTTNGIRMGIDGWLYIGNGDYGTPKAVGVDGSTVVLRGGGILRVRPDGTELELFCSGLRNPFDIAIDPKLNMFTRDNTNDGGGWDTRVSQLFQSAEYGYPRLFANFSDEIMPTLGTFGSGGGTGSLFVQDASWPTRFNDSLFTSDWGRSAVFHHPLKSDGPTFQLSQEPFAKVPRATGMDIDVSGNLYVASWWSGEASVYVGPQVGFVTRVSPKGAKREDFRSLKSLSSSELIDLLKSPQAVVRFHAQGEMLKRGRDAAMRDGLRRAVVDTAFPLDGRIAALYAVKQIEGAESQSFLFDLTDDATVREHAIRALADRKSELTGLSAAKLTEFLNDESLRVRAQAIIALGRIGDATVADRLIPLTDSIEITMPDPAKPNAKQVLPHLATQSLVQLNAVGACLRSLNSDHWRGGLRALRLIHSAEAVDGLIAKLQSEQDAEHRRAILATLIRLYHIETPYDGSWWGIRPDTTGPYFDPKTWGKSKQIKNVVLASLNDKNADVVSSMQTELKRHQLDFLISDGNKAATPGDDFQPIAILPVDATNPKQIGNMKYDDVVTRTLATKGSVESGAKLFANRSCNACHTWTFGQKPVGPHLAEIGKRYKVVELIESILKPSEKIAQGYETQKVLLESGTVLTGFVIGESGRQISLRDTQGKTHIIDRNEIEDRSRQKSSAMPEGLAASLEPQEMADLIAYLQSL